MASEIRTVEALARELDLLAMAAHAAALVEWKDVNPDGAVRLKGEANAYEHAARMARALAARQEGE